MILLDTHALIWWVNGAAELSIPAARAIQKSRKSGRINVSSMSVWETAMLIRHERLVLSIPLVEWVDRIEKLPFVQFLPVDNGIALDSVNLPGHFHKDPADRIIVSTARVHNLPLVTRDGNMHRYKHVKTVW